MIRDKLTTITLSVLTATFLSLYAHSTRDTQPVIRQSESVAYMPVTEREPVHIIRKQTAVKPELWHGTDRKLSEYEWDIMGQVIMAEARGESFEVQYGIACTILNRVDSPLFPNTVAGVIYQTEPVQFHGAWDSQEYEVTDSVWEAVQAALIRNELPEDVYYFTSEGWLPGTEPWKRIGDVWFSRQG